MNIGIDLGGTNIAGGIVDDIGQIVIKKTAPTLPKRGVDAVIYDIISICKHLISESPVDVQSVGIGCPGTVYPPSGILMHAPNLGFCNMPIADMLKKELSIPVHIENDANCAALAEAAWGAAAGSCCSVTITLGTGIGGGIITSGKIYGGAFFGAGEVGHHIIRMDEQAQQCACGQRGCWEAHASATALIRDAGGGTPAEIFAAGGHVVDNYLDHLCVGLTNIINILQPEILVIGGGISGQGNVLLKAIHARMGATKSLIALAKLGNDAGIIGAAMLGAFQE